jgi:hypothetical protein
MIHLTFGASGSSILRLTKVATLLNPFYIFQIINEQSKVNTLFTSDNISPEKLIYDEFILTSTTQSVGPTQGIINNLPGVYQYNIYETLYEYDLNIASASYLRSGELVISGPNDFSYKSFTQSDFNTTNVFNINDY